MNIKINKIDSSTNWINGTINDYEFQAKHFDCGSMFGIDEGRTSKLIVMKDGDCVVNYDRGWDIEPNTVDQIEMCNELVNYLETLPKRFENEYKL